MLNLGNASADKAQEADLHPHNVVWGGTTVAQELRTLVAGRHLTLRLAEIIDIAKWVEARRDIGHHGPEHILELRKSLFKAQVAHAEEYLAFLLPCEDYDDPWEFFDAAIAALAKAIADYLNLPPSKSWTVDRLKAR